MTDDIWGHIDNIDNMDPSAPESSKTATIKIINQKNEQKEKLLQRVNYQVNSMVMTCIHPPEQCIKNENGTFLCTFCQKNFALRVPIEK